MATGRTAAMRPVARGDIVLVAFPFTDLSQTKRRPAVVLWAAPTQTDFTLAFISSQQIGQIAVGETAVLPTHPEFSLTGLAVPSKIRATKLVTLSRVLVTRWLGRIGPLLTADVDRALIAAFGINTALYREEGRRDEHARLVALYRAGGAAALFADLALE
jgi:mRNA-degrading endonuclease toxin of MazEF toxin-antitoxin module